MANLGIPNKIVIDNSKPSNLDSTWLKKVNGVPKWQIRDHYRRLWLKGILQPQLENRWVFFRFFFGDSKEGVIRRHLPGRKDFIKITAWNHLEEVIMLHGFELIPELAEIGEPNHTRKLFVELDLKNVKGPIIQSVVGSILSMSGNTLDSPHYDLRDTGGKSIHIYLDILKDTRYHKWTWTTARKVGKRLRDNLKAKYGDLIELNIQTAKKKIRLGKPVIFPDISSLKKRGGARAIGSIHYKTLRICKPVSIYDLRKMTW